SSLCRAPLVLPSFPTRRSSDLRGTDGVERAIDVVEVYVPLQSLLPDSSHAVVGVFEIYLNVEDALSAQIAAVQQPALVTTLGLRSESTRLNSSHQIISYAVFCL